MNSTSVRTYQFVSSSSKKRVQSMYFRLKEKQIKNKIKRIKIFLFLKINEHARKYKQKLVIRIGIVGQDDW